MIIKRHNQNFEPRREWCAAAGQRPAPSAPCRNGGFNLVEIALAIFVLSLGLLAIFGLFPHGLGMADIARQETQSGMFAESVFGALHARHAAANTWIPGAVGFELDEVKTAAGGNHDIRNTATRQEVRFPAHTDPRRHQTYLRYTLELDSLDGNDQVGTALLRVWPGRRGGQTHIYYTEFYPFRDVVP